MAKIIDSDIVIIGGGASGIMASLSARKNYCNSNITIIEGSFSIARKIIVSGAGRCNITNSKLKEYPENYYYDSDKKLLRSIFNQFGYDNIVNFFSNLGIVFEEEKKNNLGKIFPITNQSKNIVLLLENELKNNNINIELNTKVLKIEVNNDNSFHLVCDNKEKGKIIVKCNKVILSAGGASYPILGSDGSGFNIAKSLGHSIIEPIPAGVPLTSKSNICKALDGLRLNSEVIVKYNNKVINNSIGDILFTKYGISGSAIFDISRNISVLMHREKINNLEINIKFLNLNPLTINNHLNLLSRINSKLKLPYQLYGLIHYKLANYLINELKIPKDKNYLELNSLKKDKLINNLISYPIIISGTKGFDNAEFTSGGINTNEVDFRTLESLKIKNLYLCGEILNIDGQIGGFNLSWAFSSGFVAGKLGK